jgi:hypothetical protein
MFLIVHYMGRRAALALLVTCPESRLCRQLELARFEIAPRDQAKALEKAWAKYRVGHQLDIKGKALSTARQ